MSTLVLTHARAAGGALLPDVVLRDGRACLGAEAAGAERLDVDGRYLIPGLWDQHAHVGQWSMYARRLDLSDATSAAEAAARCRAAISGDEPVLAYGVRPQLWPDEPSAALLDEACGHVPAVVVCMDLHSAWANTAAVGHYRMVGHEPGLLREEPAFELQRRMGDVAPDVLDGWVHEAMRAAAARGIVGVVDMEMTWNLEPWRRRMAAGYDLTRVRASIYPQWLEQALATGLRTGDVDPAHPLLAVGPLKCITDGSLNTRTAYCHDPYPGSSDHGVLSFDRAQIHDLLARATAGGITAAIHAIGDAAVALCLDAFAATGARGRLEHAQLVADADVARLAELGLAASVQPQHALDDRTSAARIWPGREHRMYRFRDLADAGTTLVFGSDAPVAALDPWHQIQAAVERALPGDEPFFPAQCLTPAQALAASTDGHGCAIVDGMVADLCLVEADPFTARGADLRGMPVAATWLAGRWTHRAL